ncbi:hypothetical protein ACFLX0_02435 [Chloroflexota bacterium]
MAQQQAIVKGDALQKLGSAGFIIGAILLLIFNILLPRASDSSNVQEVLTKWGEQEGLVKMCALLLAVGIWGLMIGIVGVYRSISTGGGASWVRLGFYGVVVGTTVWTISFALVMATADTAATWVAAPAAGKDAAYGIAAAVNAVDETMHTMSIIVYWLALVFLGIGMVLSSVYPRWMGWVVLVLGIVTMATGGIIPIFAGPASATMMIFAILSVLTTIWALVLGIWVARKAW